MWLQDELLHCGARTDGHHVVSQLATMWRSLHVALMGWVGHPGHSEDPDIVTQVAMRAFRGLVFPRAFSPLLLEGGLLSFA